LYGNAEWIGVSLRRVDLLQKLVAWVEKYQQWFRLPLVIVMALVALSIAVIRPDFSEQLELKLLDQRFKLRGVVAPDPRVMIVTVDDNALSEVGRWPWSRDKIAVIVERILGEYQAKALGFDIVFSEEQLNPLQESLRLLKAANQSDKQVAQWLKEHQSVGDIDARLQRVLTQYHDRLVPGYFFYPRGSNVPELAAKELASEMALLQASAMTSELSPEAMGSIPQLAAIEGNLPRFTQQADAVGFFNFFPDVDGTVRRVPLMVERDGYVFPSLDMQLLRIYKGWPDMRVKVGAQGVESVYLGEQSIRTDASGSMLLNHYGPGYTFSYVSAADVLAGRVDKNVLKDAIVLLGVTAVGVFDYRPSPFDSVFPGVEGHAAAISNILRDEEIYRPDGLDGMELLAVLLLALVCGRLVMGRGPVLQAMIIFAVPSAILALAMGLFVQQGIDLHVTYLLLAVLLTTVPVTLLEYMAESRRRAFIHAAFSNYLPAKVVDGLIKNPEKLNLGGEEKHLTAMFTDIASFSTFSEQLNPQELVAFLNQYLTAMSDIILQYGGTIDKYEGDAIIAFFGAPVDMQEHAVQCVLAALEQQKVLQGLRQKWKQAGYPEVHIRIGINSGPMVVGNMGTHSHKNYTMMGDHVNLASRLEGVCKIYRTPILISRDTYLLVKDKIAARFVDRVRVVGRKQPVDLFEPLGEFNAEIEESLKIHQKYEQAWTLMKNNKFDEASMAFLQLHKAYPNEILYEVMLARASHFINEPPSPAWHGVFDLDCK